MSGKHKEEECEEQEEEEKSDWRVWTDALEELSQIEDAFELDENGKLPGKKILDVGTDCVKPLYIALKFEPCKIIGISDELPNFASDLELESRLLAKTKISFYTCNFFNKETLEEIKKEEEIKKFDIVLLSKTLHHLRTGKCVLHEREEHKNHTCRDDEKCCVYEFKEKEIFDRLFELGERVTVYEAFYPHEKDIDKVRGRGGHFTIKEWERIFSYLLKNHNVKLIRPTKYRPSSKDLKKELEKIEAKLRQIDYICFCVEK